MDSAAGFTGITSDTPRGEALSRMSFGGGMLFYSKQLLVGVSLHHINQPDVSPSLGYALLPMKLGVQVAYAINASEKVIIQPHFRFISQGPLMTLIIGTAVRAGNMDAGLAYRNKDAIIASLGYTHAKIAVRAAYDYTVSDLSNSLTGDSVELGISYKLGPVRGNGQFIPASGLF